VGELLAAALTQLVIDTASVYVSMVLAVGFLLGWRWLVLRFTGADMFPTIDR
jgi:hypothetical protein